jgi:hypothetical protein
MGSPSPSEQLEIERLLDLDNDMSDQKRCLGLERFFRELVIPKLVSIDSEADVDADLRQRPHLNAVPGVVKKHFKL